MNSWTCHSCGHQQRIRGICVVCGELLLVFTDPSHKRSFCRDCRTAGVPNMHFASERCFTKTVRRRLWDLRKFIVDRRHGYNMYDIMRRMSMIPTQIRNYMEVDALFSVWHRDKRNEALRDPHMLHDLRVEDHRAGGRAWEDHNDFQRRVKR